MDKRTRNPDKGMGVNQKSVLFQWSTSQACKKKREMTELEELFAFTTPLVMDC
jgi:hypothetical protein